MKPTDVTSQQQSQEFVIATNLVAVNYGKNVGSDLIEWPRTYRLGTGGIGAAII
jgi:hypothetical protein